MQQPQPPTYMDALQSNDPKMAELLTTGREFIMTDGALSAKVKTLMTMVCDALLTHHDGVGVIAERARGMGATEAEITEAREGRLLDGWIARARYGMQRLQEGVDKQHSFPTRPGRLSGDTPVPVSPEVSGFQPGTGGRLSRYARTC